MAKLISVRNRDGWAWPGFRAGTHTLSLATDLKDWRVYVRPTKVFFQRGTTLHEESRDVVTLSWELTDGETVDSLQKWDPPEPVRPPEKAKAK